MAKFLNKFRLPFFSTDSASPTEGEIWYNSALDQIRYKTPGTYNLSVHAGQRFNDYAVGRWYMTQTGVSGTTTATVSRAFTNAFVVPRTATLSGVTIEISTAWTTAGNVRLGIYNDDGGRLPTALVADYGTQAATVGIKTFAVSTVLSPGAYWLVAVNQGGSGATSGQYRSVTGQHEFIGDPAASPTSAFMNGSLNCYYSDTGFTGVLPATFGNVTGVALGPRFAIRFSA